MTSDRPPESPFLLQAARQLAHAQLYLLSSMDETTRSFQISPLSNVPLGVDLVRATLSQVLSLLDLAYPPEPKAKRRKN